MPDAQKINLGASLAPAGNISLENIPIRTMREDLKNVGNTNFNPDEMPEPMRVTGIMPIGQASSPFLASQSPSPKISSAPISAPAPAPTANPFQRTINPLVAQPEKTETETEQPESNLSLKKTFFISGIIFLLLAMAVGGYYYWMSQQTKEVTIQPEPMPEPENIPVEVPETTPVVTPIFSIDKPNYLVLDIKTADAVKIKAEIKDRADKLIATGIITPVEFVTSDANFTPLSFKYFANTLGLKLSDKFIANLEEKFSLFIYNDSGKTKLGLLLDAKDEKLAKIQLTQAESLLISQLNPLYMDMPYTIKDNKFSNGQYGDLVIRYNNLVSDHALSLDYGLYGKKIIIGTSKMTLRSIYDYLKSTTISTPAGITTTTTTLTNTTGQ